MENSSSKRTPRVFLSYAHKDFEVARNIAEQLKAYGVSLWYDEWELKPGDSIVKSIETTITSSDYIVILLSPNSVKSKWVQQEISMALTHELTKRDVVIIPVVIADCEIPSSLKNIKGIDLRQDWEQNSEILIEQIVSAPRIDFTHFNERTFVSLVVDLIESLGFKNIQPNYRFHAIDRRFFEIDIKAEYVQKDPFGFETCEIWLIETKLYKHKRADLRALSQIMLYLQAFPKRSKGLLVTNGQLTSVVKEWLKITHENTGIQIRVIEGPELKRLLLFHPDLIRKYFPTKEGAIGES